MVKLAQLSATHRQILIALQSGSVLQVQRTIDGAKYYRLSGMVSGVYAEVEGAVATKLEEWGLVASNMKFPTATLLLTDEGARFASQLTGALTTPVGPRNFGA